MRVNYDIEKFTKIYISDLIEFHSVAMSIVSNRSTRSTSYFWTKLQSKLGTQLDLRTFHPQMDGYFKRTIQVLEELL